MSAEENKPILQRAAQHFSNPEPGPLPCGLPAATPVPLILRLRAFRDHSVPFGSRKLHLGDHEARGIRQ